jgi:hypothetical protein
MQHDATHRSISREPLPVQEFRQLASLVQKGDPGKSPRSAQFCTIRRLFAMPANQPGNLSLGSLLVTQCETMQALHFTRALPLLKSRQLASLVQNLTRKNCREVHNSAQFAVYSPCLRTSLETCRPGSLLVTQCETMQRAAFHASPLPLPNTSSNWLLPKIPQPPFGGKPYPCPSVSICGSILALWIGVHRRASAVPSFLLAATPSPFSSPWVVGMPTTAFRSFKKANQEIAAKCTILHNSPFLRHKRNQPDATPCNRLRQVRGILQSRSGARGAGNQALPHPLPITLPTSDIEPRKPDTAAASVARYLSTETKHQSDLETIAFFKRLAIGYGRKCRNSRAGTEYPPALQLKHTPRGGLRSRRRSRASRACPTVRFHAVEVAAGAHGDRQVPAPRKWPVSRGGRRRPPRTLEVRPTRTRCSAIISRLPRRTSMLS